MTHATQLELDDHQVDEPNRRDPIRLGDHFQHAAGTPYDGTVDWAKQALTALRADAERT